MIVIGADLSLTSTGLARIDTDTGAVTVRRVESTAPKTPRDRNGKPIPPTLDQRRARLRRIYLAVTEWCSDGDLVVVEGPSYGSNTGSAHDRSGLWWLLVGRLPRVAEVAPATRIRYALGKGAGGKDLVLAAAINRYRHCCEITGNDVADAMVLASMGARWLGRPIEVSLPQTHIAALDAVRWPALEGASS